jgi:hypothetical protein
MMIRLYFNLEGFGKRAETHAKIILHSVNIPAGGKIRCLCATCVLFLRIHI